MMFRFYGIAFYFLNNDILVILIVIICFIFFGKDRRDPHQQKKGINRKFQAWDHIKHFTKQIINRAIIIAGFRKNAEVLKKDSADTKKPPVGGFLCAEGKITVR